MIHLPDWLKSRTTVFHADAVRLGRWARKSGPFFAGSAAAHVLGVIVVLACTVREDVLMEADTFDEVDTEIKEPEVARFVLGTPPVSTTELSTHALALTQPPAQDAKHFDDSRLFEDAGGGTMQASDEPALGGLGGEVGVDLGSALFVDKKTGVGIGLGTSDRPGNGGPEEGFLGAGKGERPELKGGEAEESERAVAAALNWLRRHQHGDGSWSLTGYACHCRDELCSGACDTIDDVLATSLAVLPFLASGQSHIADGPYQRSLDKAIHWLLAQQTADGGFSTFSPNTRPTHAIATLCLCEAYAMTGDTQVGDATQRAVQFLERQLLTIDGWQWAAISSAQQAGLAVDEQALLEAHRWYADHWASRVGEWGSGGMAATGKPMDDYSPPLPPSPPHPLIEFTGDFPSSDDVTECFVTMPISDRREWNRCHEPIRRRLLETQVNSGCATGSWYDETEATVCLPHQGRLPTTCFAAILLAASYRHLPMHKAPVSPVARRPIISNRN